MKESEIISRAKEIHTRVLTLDTHIDIERTFFTSEKPDDFRYEKMASLTKMNAGGMDGAFFSVYIKQAELTGKAYSRAYEQTIKKMESIHHIAKKFIPDKVEIAYSPEDVYKIHHKGKKVAVICLENGYPIGKEIGNIKKFFSLGTRYITLCHNGHNQICTSHNNPEGTSVHYDGLSLFGRKVIEEMNRLGIMIDVSHLSKKSMLEAVEVSKTPVIASHTGCRSLCDISRNMDDDQILAIQKCNGVISIFAINEFLKKNSKKRIDAIHKLRLSFDFPTDLPGFLRAFSHTRKNKQEMYLKRVESVDKKFPPAGTKDLVDHIDHVVKLAGIDHVGIGSDYFSSLLSLDGMMDAGEAFHITIELVRRGYTEEDIKKIWSGNIIRVWEKVSSAASEFRKRSQM